MTRDCPHCHRPMPEPCGVICNDDARIVMFDGHVSDPLTKHEYELVRYLVRHFDQFCTAERIGDWLYQLAHDPPEWLGGTISTFAGRARKKLAPLGLTIEGHCGGLGWKILRASDKAQTRVERNDAPSTEEALP